jgi:hypothetical protein
MLHLGTPHAFPGRREDGLPECGRITPALALGRHPGAVELGQAASRNGEILTPFLHIFLWTITFLTP